MGKIISVINQKGGVGKTTTCMNLLGVFIDEYGMKEGVACAVDLDPEQESAYQWSEQGDFFKGIVHRVNVKNPKNDVESMKKKSKIVLIDTCPQLEAPAIKAALLSDLIIVPCGPGNLDLDATKKTISMIDQVTKPFLLMFLNDRYNAIISKITLEALESIGPVASQKLLKRAQVREAACLGTWIGRYKKDETSHLEFRSLANEILSHKALKGVI